jgi:hypothetical protein
MTDARRRWLSLRTLRSVASVFCFTLCVGFVLLWVRSYWWADWVVPARGSPFWVCSTKGGIIFCSGPMPNEGLSMQTMRVEDWEDELSIHLAMTYPPNETLGFWRGKWARVYTIERMPDWFFTVATAVLAIAMKPSPRYRFSLFDVLALTTFAALLAGLVAWLVRLRE